MPTPSFCLRTPVQQDILPYAGFLADPVVTLGLEDRVQRPVQLEAVQDFLFNRAWAGWSIDCDGQFVGFSGFSEYAPDLGTARFFIVIGARPFWGKGLGTAVAREVVRTGFVSLGLRKIVSDFLDINDAARIVHERAGFIEEGRLRRDAWRQGKWVDRVLVSILNDEFDKGTRQP